MTAGVTIDAARGGPAAAVGRSPATTTSLDVRIDQETPILLHAALSCRDGELLALVGPSGSGKTSILRSIAGLLLPRAGAVVCGGETWLDTERGVLVPPQQRRVGFVFQDYALFPHLTALENVMVPLAARDRPDFASHANREARGRELLRLVNLEGLEHRRPSHLSGGQVQRVALARALAREPRVLLLDEPFSAVDQMTREKLQRELVALRTRLNIPILLVTHDVDEALALADRVAVLHHGHILQTDAPDEIRLRPATPTVARLVGQMNVFSGALVQPSTPAAPGLLKWGPLPLEVRDTGQATAGSEVQWVVARDHIVLHRRGRPSQGERENPVTGIIRELVMLGERALATVEVDAVEGAVLNFMLEAHAARRNELQAGAEVRVSLLAEGIHLFPSPGSRDDRTHTGPDRRPEAPSGPDRG